MASLAFTKKLWVCVERKLRNHFQEFYLHGTVSCYFQFLAIFGNLRAIFDISRIIFGKLRAIFDHFTATFCHFQQFIPILTITISIICILKPFLSHFWAILKPFLLILSHFCSFWPFHTLSFFCFLPFLLPISRVFPCIFLNFYVTFNLHFSRCSKGNEEGPFYGFIGLYKKCSARREN